MPNQSFDLGRVGIWTGAFDSVSLLFNKVAGIVPMTEELMRFSTPSAEMLMRNALIGCSGNFI